MIEVETGPAVTKTEADTVVRRGLIFRERVGERQPRARVVRLAGGHFDPATGLAFLFVPVVAPDHPASFAFELVGNALDADGESDRSLHGATC